MSAVDAEKILPADELWWYWSVLAATHQSVGNWHCRLIEDFVLAHDEPGGSWAKMQRFRGGRAVLWGRDVDSEDDALSNGVDVLSQVPVWAITPLVEQSVNVDGVGFVAWFQHGEWDTSTPDFDDGSDLILQVVSDIGAVAAEAKRVHPPVILDLLPRVIDDARNGVLGADTFRTYLGGTSGNPEYGRLMLIDALQLSDPTVNTSLREHLRAEIHSQMQASLEIAGRKVAERPSVLVQWSRVAGLDFAFEHSVLIENGRTIGAPSNVRLPEQYATTLTNVLRRLHHDEAAEESGAWLFARVAYDGKRITCDRAYDSWPSWFKVTRTSQGPSLEGLHWEMEQRTPPWKPAWSSLL